MSKKRSRSLYKKTRFRRIIRNYETFIPSEKLIIYFIMDNKNNKIEKYSSLSITKVENRLLITEKLILSGEQKLKKFWKDKLYTLFNNRRWEDVGFNWQELLEESNNCINRLPLYEYGYLYRGKARLELKDIPGALCDFNKCIELNYNDAIVYYWRRECINNSQKWIDAGKEDHVKV